MRKKDVNGYWGSSVSVRNPSRVGSRPKYSSRVSLHNYFYQYVYSSAKKAVPFQQKKVFSTQ